MKGYGVKGLSLITVALLVFSLLSCVKTTRPLRTENINKAQDAAKSKKKKSVKTEDLSDYIRKTLKMSEETRAQKADSSTGTLLENTIPELSQYKLAVAAHPTDVTARLQLAAEYHTRGIYDMALNEYNAALKLDPNQAGIYESLGRLWRDWGAPAAGVEDLKRALTLKPDFFEAHNSLGITYDLMGDYESAEKSYKTAIRLNPNLDYVHNNLCYNYLLQGKLEKALDQCQAALKLNPTSAVAHNNLGLIYGKMGDFERSRQAFAAASDEAGGYNNLGLVYVEKKMYDQAQEAFKRAAELRPGYLKASENYDLAARLKFEERAVAGANPTMGKMDGYTAVALDAQKKSVETPTASDVAKTAAAQRMVVETAARRSDQAAPVHLTGASAPVVLYQPELPARSKDRSPSFPGRVGSEQLSPEAVAKSISSVPWARMELGTSAQALPTLPLTAVPSLGEGLFKRLAPVNRRSEILNPVVGRDPVFSHLSNILGELKLRPVQGLLSALSWSRLEAHQLPAAQATTDLQMLPLMPSLQKALEARIAAAPRAVTFSQPSLANTSAPINAVPAAKLPVVRAVAQPLPDAWTLKNLEPMLKAPPVAGQVVKGALATGRPINVVPAAKLPVARVARPLPDAWTLKNLEPVLKAPPVAGQVVEGALATGRQIDEAKLRIREAAKEVSQVMSAVSTASRTPRVSRRTLSRETGDTKSEAVVPGKPVAAHAAPAVGASGPVAGPLRQTMGMTVLAFIAGLAFLAALILLASLGLALWPKKQ